MFLRHGRTIIKVNSPISRYDESGELLVAMMMNRDSFA